VNFYIDLAFRYAFDLSVVEGEAKWLHVSGGVMISSQAVVESSEIAEDVQVGEFSIIRPDVRIGRGSIIHPHVVIESGVTIGEGTEIYHGAYLGKEPKGAGNIARPLVFQRSLSIGSYCQIGPQATLYYDVSIGNNTLIGDGASVREQCVIGDNCIIGRHVTIHYDVNIGVRSRVLDLSHITGSSRIGNNVFISVGVMTANDNTIGRAGYSDEHVVGITVGDDASIGVGAILTAGVVVGAKAIVGAGSLVTRNVEPHTMVLGVPARVIQRFEP
jgi:acetyltransferase-like isoleucine patch superfamily enzyme